jgi:hypothetical protein
VTHRKTSRELVLEPVNLSEASPAFRELYELHFVDTILLQRSEADWGFASRLTPAELALARRLVRANLHLGQVYLDSAAVLNDREAIPELHRMLDQAKTLTEKIQIARPLWVLERSPAYPALIERLVRGKDAALKQQHIFEILLLGDERAIDHLYTMAEDRDESVRDLALFHLTRLANAWKGTFWNSQSTKTPELSYFQERRGKPRFIRRMLKELRRWHHARPLDI